MSIMSKSEVPIEFVRALNELGLSNASSLWGTPLTGGVSSDIWRIETEKGMVCAKRALSKLRVNADWYAPVERNLFEARWLQVAHQACAACAPELLGQHPGLGVLVMQYLEPDHYRLWKQELHAGHADSQTAHAMGQVLSKIHSYAAKNSHLASEFPTDKIFFEIRLAPYLLATAEHHPQLAHALEALVLQTQNNAKTLVHGDVSPKNILLGPQGPLLLDAECATWSDPAFDLAFCLNHLLLKCLWTPASTADFLHCFEVLTTSYLSSVDWEPPSDLEARAARLLPGLLLARVDGKSPVEYVTEEHQREHVRRVASTLLIKPASSLQEVAQAWAKDLKT
ncbi:phosphotransferase family protein [Limnohabitans sp.]|jgi:aminoglycoside phosphotransferase (APT) family kinase protein|uniref:phosphotransferase family protein n=1 Tax=Limnohabitans sp. TaxID=1907725 RepID=UPI0037BE79F3